MRSPLEDRYGGRFTGILSQPARQVFKKDFVQDFTGKIFGSWKGRKYGAWGADLDPSKATTDLIEDPAHIIESIFQDELSFTNLDIPSINTATVDRANWKFARSLTAQINSLDVIKSICEEAGLVLVSSGAGKERLVALCNATSTTINLTSADFENDGEGGSLASAGLSSTETVYNEFRLNYKYNYAKGNFDSQRFCTASDDNLADNTRSNADGNGATYRALCSGSQTKINKTRAWSFDSYWIRTEAVADLFIKLMMNWLAVRKWIFDATILYTANTLKLEMADRIKITSDLLPATVSNTRQFIVTRLVDGGMSRIGRIDGKFLMIPQVI
jgi:hypothetical protein